MNEMELRERIADAKARFADAVSRGDVDAEKAAWSELTKLNRGAREVALGSESARQTDD